MIFNAEGGKRWKATDRYGVGRIVSSGWQAWAWIGGYDPLIFRATTREAALDGLMKGLEERGWITAFVAKQGNITDGST